MKRILGAVIVFGLLICQPVGVLGEGPIESQRGLIYPEYDFKYVQFLPIGHLTQNKPKYGKYDWRILKSKHFSIYTYGDSDGLPEVYLAEAEKIYDEFSKKMKMNAFSEQLKIIVCNSVRDFEETNMVPGIVPPGLGGFTELLKWKRVLVAFRDSLIGFRRLIRHELTHRYQAEFLQLSLGGMQVGGNMMPLWFLEGHAQHLGHSWDATGEMMVRDAYLYNYLGSITDDDLPPYLVYTQGAFICRYLATKYQHKGDVLSAICRETRKLGFKKAFEKVTGKSLAEFDKEVNRYTEETFYYLRPKTDITDYACTLDNAMLLASRNNLFLTRKTVLGRDALFINWTDGKKVGDSGRTNTDMGNVRSKKLVEDGRIRNVAIQGPSLGIELEFGFYEHGASFVSDNAVVYAIDVGGRDEIRVQHFSFDSKKKKFRLGKVETYLPKAVRDIQHPIMINENEFVFIGRDNVFAEVFLLNKKTGEVKKLTSVKRNCRGLTYSKPLNALVTSVENEETQSYDLAFGDLNTGEWRLLTKTAENEFFQEFSPDGTKLLYVSDVNLVHNLYLYDLKANTVTALTDVKIGVFRPKWFQDKGVLFNSIREYRLLVQVAQLPTEHVGAKVEPKPETKTALDTELLRRHLPDADSLTIMETVVSEDKTKVLFVVNRKLSLETLKRGEPEVGFCLADLTENKTTKFTLKEFSKIEEFARAEFLAGTNILVQKDKTSYVYDWKTKKTYVFGKEAGGVKITVLNFKPEKDLVVKVSQNRRYLILLDDNGVRVCDVIQKQITHQKKSSKILDAVFVSDRPLVLEKSAIPKKENFVSWHPLPDMKNIFLVSQSKSGDKRYSIWLLNTEKHSTTLFQSDLPVVKEVKIQDATLVVETENQFGRKRELVIDLKGQVVAKDEPMPYTPQRSLLAPDPMTPLTPQVFKVKPIPYKVAKPSSIPKPYTGFGGGSIGMGTSAIGIALLARDDLDNHMLTTYVYLQNWKYGFANVNYYDLVNRRSFGLDYQYPSDYRHKLELSASQNIFLDRFLNWDVTVKEQFVKTLRSSWLRSKLGTTFSLDTTVNDWHGPLSGDAVFTGLEVGINDKLELQNLDLNLDARHYMPFTRRSGMAFRLAGGQSFGPSPIGFIWGGNQTFRGIPLFSQSGNRYVLQSTELRFPIFDVIGAKVSGPADSFFGPLIRYIDVRGGIYNDIGDIWYQNEKDKIFRDDHQGFRMQYSAGVFLNAPIFIGGGVINLRYNKGLYGLKDWNFWLGYNW